MSHFDFSNLSPDLILDAIESVGIYPESGLLPLNSYENRVYQFKADDNKRYVVKFYRPERWSDEQILEEHEFCDSLLEHDVPLGAPIKINSNTLFNFNGFRFCIYKSIGGRMFELDNLDQIEWLGRLLGKLHKASSNQVFTFRDTINIEQELLQSTQALKQTNFIPEYLQNTFFSDLALLTERVLENNSTQYQTIKLHGDCHAGNILWQSHDAKSDAILVDFDDCLNGPAIQDIWMMLNGDRQQKLMQLDVMINAYEEFHEFNHAEFALIEPLRARRMVNYMAWISKRWSDPAFPRNFSWFNTDKYWEQQILAMKEQISALNESTLCLYP